MISYWGFEPEVSKLVGKDSLDYMSFNYSKFSDDLVLACIGA